MNDTFGIDEKDRMTGPSGLEMRTLLGLIPGPSTLVGPQENSQRNGLLGPNARLQKSLPALGATGSVNIVLQGFRVHFYRYVGSRAIAESVVGIPEGNAVTAAEDVLRWVRDTHQETDANGNVVATFVVDEADVLRIADRCSEHVACAGQRAVRTAGEITFQVSSTSVDVIAVSNQSTGYCPEPSSWSAVETALRRAGLSSPGHFDPAFEFRRCTSCNTINVVKDGDFECAVCGFMLPQNWNVYPL